MFCVIDVSKDWKHEATIPPASSEDSSASNVDGTASATYDTASPSASYDTYAGQCSGIGSEKFVR